MKSTYYLLVIISIVTLLSTSCEQENNNNNNNNNDNNNNGSLIVTGELVGNSSCKIFKSVESNSETPDTLSCVNYDFDVLHNTLNLKHINAGFNCCPESLYCEVSVVGDTIIIEEFEQAALCYCNCLFDLDIKLNGISPKMYYVKIIEPYAEDQEKLNFEMDLENDSRGSYCVTRKLYPWGTIDYEEDVPPEIYGQVIAHTDCKSFKSGDTYFDTSNTVSCIDYTFNPINNELFLTHINACFNCCPDSLYCSVSLRNDTITIQEFEKNALCDCLCLFDLEIKIEGIESKTYFLKVIEPYVEINELSFKVDLVHDQEGSHCVTRNDYPWGM